MAATSKQKQAKRQLIEILEERVELLLGECSMVGNIIAELESRRKLSDEDQEYVDGIAKPSMADYATA